MRTIGVAAIEVLTMNHRMIYLSVFFVVAGCCLAAEGNRALTIDVTI